MVVSGGMETHKGCSGAIVFAAGAGQAQKVQAAKCTLYQPFRTISLI